MNKGVVYVYLYVLHSYSTQGPHFSSYGLILQDGANFVRNDCFVAGMRGVKTVWVKSKGVFWHGNANRNHPR